MSTNPAFFAEDTIDDLMRSVIESTQKSGRPNSASRGATRELTGVLLELRNPRARLSLTESRGRPFSCLGELCWYLAASDDVEFISYYLPPYRDEAEDGVIFGAYGPRLFRMRGTFDQVQNVTQLLRDKPATRRAVIQLFDAADLVGSHHEVPCTCTLQFLLREGSLHLLASMRSNDVIVGLPHDIYCFTMLQEMLARELNVELGGYKHAVGSLHVYDDDAEEATKFLDEGLQSTKSPMPSMPLGSPLASIDTLLKAEKEIRLGDSKSFRIAEDLDPYWMDLVRMLLAFRYIKDGRIDEIAALRNELSFGGFRPFVDKHIRRLRERLGGESPTDVSHS